MDDDDPEAPGKHCRCGYLRTGLVPERLCLECGDRVIARWRNEERRVLALMPAYAAEVADVLRETAGAQRAALRKRRGEPREDAAWELNKGGWRLARLRRAHRDDLSHVSLERWRELAELAARDRREVMRVTAKRMTKRGLGAAAIVRMISEGDAFMSRRS